MKKRLFYTLLALAVLLLAGGVLWYRYGGTDEPTKTPGEATQVKAEPEIEGFGPEDLVVGRPDGATEKPTASPLGETEVVVSVPTQASSGQHTTAPEGKQPRSDTANGNVDTTSIYTDLRIERQDRWFEEFYKYQGGVTASVSGPDSVAEKILVTPQPRPLIEPGLSFTAGATLSFDLRMGAYVSVSPIRIWGLRPAWFGSYSPGRLETGPGAHFDLLPRLSAGGFYGLTEKAPHITIGYRF